MQIYGPTHLHGPQPINTPHNARVTQPRSPHRATDNADRLDISESGRIAARLSEIPDIRADKVAAARAAIAAGTYETEQRLEGAVDALLDEMG